MAKNLALEIAIKAKNLASSAFDKVKDSLTDTSAQANKTEKTLDDLSKTLDDIGESSAVIDEFKLLNKEITNSEKTTKKLKTELNAYEKQAAESGNDTAEFKQEVTRLKTEIDKAEKAIKDKRSALDKTVKSLKNADINTDELARAEKELASQARKTRNEIADKNKALNNTKPSASTGSAGIASLTKTVIGLGAAYVSVDKLFDSLTAIFTTGDKFEKLRIQFEGLMGSVEAGEQATAWVKDFTKNTPLQLEQVSQVFVKLKSFGIDPMNGSLQAITDQAFKLGGGFQEVEGISLALGQAWAKQKLQGEEILQLIERGVPVWELLEKATGKNTAELQKLSTAGELGRDVIQQLMDTIAQEAAGSAAKNMGTLSGLISNAKDNLAQFYNEISEAGAMEWLKEQLADVNARFKQMAEDGTLKQWAKDISNAIINIGEGIKSTIDFLVEYRKEIAAVVTAWAALKVGSFFKNVVSGAATGITALTDFVRKGVTPANVEVNKANASTSKFNKLLGKAGLAGAALGAGVAIGQLINKLFDLHGIQELNTKAILEGQVARGKYKQQLADINQQTGQNFKSIKAAIEQQEKGNLVLDKATQKWIYHADGIAVYRKEIEQAEKAQQAANQALIESQQTAIQSVDTIGDTSDAWIKNAGTVEQAKAALDQHIKALEQDMPVGAQRAIDELRRLRGEMQQQIEANQKLEEAYKTLGIESPAALKKAADESAAAFKLIQQDSTASQQVVSAAFLKMADDSITYSKATNQSVRENLKLKAAALGLTDVLEELEEQLGGVDRQSGESERGLKDFNRGLQQTGDQVQNVNKGLREQISLQQQLNNDRKDYNADDSRKDLTESRTLTTQGADYSEMDYSELKQKLGEFERSAVENSYAHMREYYNKQIDMIRTQIDKNNAEFIQKNTATNPQSTPAANQSGVNNSMSVPSVIQAPASDSSALNTNTQALNQLSFAIDTLNFTIQGQSQESDFLSSLENIKSTS